MQVRCPVKVSTLLPKSSVIVGRLMHVATSPPHASNLGSNMASKISAPRLADFTRSERIIWVRAVATSDQRGRRCIEWPWAKNNKGYGVIGWNGQRKAGHVILELSGRERPSPAHHQLHSCDNPGCVAPWHLRWGTNAENVADAVSRGRLKKPARYTVEPRW